MRSMVVVMMTVAVFATAGCFDAIRASKGQSPQYYSKPGATWESRDADWKACGGRGLSLIVWMPITEDVSEIRACMIGKGYGQSMTAGEPDSAPTKPAR
jgi:hypothetical protein